MTAPTHDRPARAAGPLTTLWPHIDALAPHWSWFDDRRADRHPYARTAAGYARRADQLGQALLRFVPGYPGDAAALLRRLLDHVCSCAVLADTPVLAAARRRALRRYLVAARIVAPEPVEFGRWFAGFQLDDIHLARRGRPWAADPGRPRLADVADLLGGAGLAAYRRRLAQAALVEPDHPQLPLLRDDLLVCAGDPEEIIASAVDRDLPGTAGLRRVAGLLARAGHREAAARWYAHARALAAPPSSGPDPVLTALLRGRHHRGR